ncbi:MAG: site-specific DNA-methyltransferase [bacterium]|nr:site-specific DNA-methyltransferase [bacterium]
MNQFKCAYDKIEDIAKLVPNPKNPNKHPDKQIKMLAKIIKHQGQRSPVVVSNRSGFIVKGHGRLSAIQSLGWAEVAVDYQDYESEAQEFQDMVADNKIAELAEHDDAFMIEGIHELELEDSDFELLGMDDFELPLEADEAKDEIEDDVPGDVETRCKPGDLWILGEHRLLCGDSTDILAVEKLMGGEKPDMVFTDPPYGILYDDTKNINSYAGSLKNSKFGKILNDDSSEHFKKVYDPSIDFQFWWGANYYCQDLPQDGAFSVWSKKTQAQSKVKALFNSDFEICWTNRDRRKKLFSVPWTGVMNKEKGEKRLHPTQKPIELILKYFDEWADKKINILDYFGGSGSTLIACEKTNRKCFMSELDPHYVSVIIERWKKYTDKEAYLIEDQSGPLKESVPYAEISSFRGETQ